MHGADFIKLKRHIISLSLCLWFHFQDNINCKLKNSLIYSRSEQMKTLLNLMYPCLCGLRVNCLTLHFWILCDIFNYEINLKLRNINTPMNFTLRTFPLIRWACSMKCLYSEASFKFLEVIRNINPWWIKTCIGDKSLLKVIKFMKNHVTPTRYI